PTFFCRSINARPCGSVSSRRGGSRTRCRSASAASTRSPAARGRPRSATIRRTTSSVRRSCGSAGATPARGPARRSSRLRPRRGRGLTVEAQLTAQEERGGIQIALFDPVAGRFPDEAPPARPGAPMAALDMGLGAGGRIRQKIYPDPYGMPAWDAGTCTALTVHLVNSVVFAALTREAPPPSPIDARTYTEFGLPWFDLYDEALGDVAAATPLTDVKSIAELERGRGETSVDEPSIHIADSQIRKRRL